MYRLLAVVVLLLPFCSGTPQSIKHVKKCIEEYKQVLAHYNDEKGTCTRLGVFINCLSNHPDERGQLLDAMRYFFTQQAIFVTKLNFCPDLDFVDIKRITDKTDIAKEHDYLDSVNDVHWDPCAINVHKTCVQYYVSLFSKERKICDDVSSWISCYRKEAKRIKCHAKIIKHFTDMLDVIGGLVIREIRRHIGVECVKMEL